MASGRGWKALEKLVAKVLKGKRVLRGADFSIKNVDVKVADFPLLKIDAKYRQARWAHHSYLKEIKRKYARGEGEIPVLVTRNHRERGAVVSLYLKDFGSLLDDIRRLVQEEG